MNFIYKLSTLLLAFFFIKPDHFCEAVRKGKRFNLPPKLAAPKTPLDAIQGSEDPYFKYEIMQEFPGGPITMGSKEPNSKYGEYDFKNLQAKPFYLDKYPVSLVMFKKFIRLKRKFVPRAVKQGYSYVFRKYASRAFKQSRDYINKDTPHMIKVNMASWKLPEGPGASRPLEERLLEPVVHVSYDDAAAYCNWKKKRLPSELEWEFAARGKLRDQRFPWGRDYLHNRSNLWDGAFPYKNLLFDGYEGLSPINAYRSQNQFDVYDMLGNVWEWTLSVFKEPGTKMRTDKTNIKYITKGASFLDTISGTFNHAARVSARQPLNPNTTTYNLGFRCALSKAAGDALGVYKIPQHTEL